MLMRILLLRTMHFFYKLGSKEIYNVFFNGNCMMFKKYFFLFSLFFYRIFSKLHFLSLPSSFFKRHRKMRRMKRSAVGEGA
jgi:hypothetical protein